MNHNWSVSFSIREEQCTERIGHFFRSRKNYESTTGTFEYFNLDTGVNFSFNLFPEHNVVFLSIDLKTSNSNTIREVINEINAFSKKFNLNIRYPESSNGEEPFSENRFIKKWHYIKRDYLSFQYDSIYYSVPSEKVKAVWYWNYSSQWTERFLKSLFVIPKIQFFNHYGKAQTLVTVNLNKWSAIPEADYYKLQLTQSKGLFRSNTETVERVVSRMELDEVFRKCRFLPLEKTPFYKLRPEDFKLELRELLALSEERKIHIIETSKIIDKEIFDSHKKKKLEETTL